MDIKSSSSSSTVERVDPVFISNGYQYVFKKPYKIVYEKMRDVYIFLSTPTHEFDIHTKNHVDAIAEKGSKERGLYRAIVHGCACLGDELPHAQGSGTLRRNDQSNYSRADARPNRYGRHMRTARHKYDAHHMHSYRAREWKYRPV